ncbi:MAG TPA: PIN domain-containing protein [Pseudonocardiaceae bacterium]|nr:PIN domain-containing protein [Pseudonocardiaceae bacterium]
MSHAVVVDAGPLYAYIDADDADHQRCVEFLACHDGTLIIPQLVITEVCYLVQTRLGTHAELLFLGDLASGAFSVEPMAATDWFRVIELVDKYRDFPLGTVDATVVVCAERLGISDVATLDHRYFRAIRPGHVKHFTLLPS